MVLDPTTEAVMIGRRSSNMVTRRQDTSRVRTAKIIRDMALVVKTIIGDERDGDNIIELLISVVCLLL